jgi:uncharacterized protein YggE
MTDQKAYLARFHCTRLEEARRAAVRDAMKLARQKAEELAELSHARLAGPASVHEVIAPSSGSSTRMAVLSSMVSGGDSSDLVDGDARSSPTLKPIPITAVVEVQFATERSK